MTRNPPERTGPVTRLPYIDLELDAAPAPRPPSRLYVVAPTMYAFDAWCYDHHVHPRNPAAVAILPSNYLQKLCGGARGPRYVETDWNDRELTRWWEPIAWALRTRDAMYASGDELAAWLAEQGGTAPAARPVRGGRERSEHASSSGTRAEPDPPAAIAEAAAGGLAADLHFTFTADTGDFERYTRDALVQSVPTVEIELSGEVYPEAAARFEGIIEAINQRTDERIAAWRARRSDGIDWGEPLEPADANTPAPGDTCAHICGPDPDHECQARATDVIEHSNLAGGTTRMPVCGPCHQSETTAMEASHG